MQTDTLSILFNEEAEQAILSGLMIDPHVLEDDPLQVEEFSSTRNQCIYKVQRELIERNIPVDYMTLITELKSRGLLEQAGGNAFLAEVAMAIPSTAGIPHYVEIVKKCANRRRLEKVAKQILQQTAGGTPTDEIIRCIEEAISKTQPAGGWIHNQDAIKAALDEIEAAYRGDRGHGLTTGLRDLDEKSGGFNPGNLIVVAGRPGMGKTSFAVGAALAASEAGATVGICTMEMSRTEIIKKELAIRGKNISIRNLDRGTLSYEGWMDIVQTAEALSRLNIYLFDEANLTATGIRRWARYLHRTQGLDLLVVDYLQLITSDRQSHNRVEAMSEISRALKILAKELSIPVLALSQLNRQCDTREDKRPLLSDLRESGSIEQDADVVMFLYRDEEYNHETLDKGIAEIIIRKNRHGPTDIARVVWCGHQTGFKDLSE